MRHEARALAKEFIRRYVERGFDYDSIKRGWGGAGSLQYSVHIGANNAWGKAKYGADTITVDRVAGMNCCEQFSVRELYDEIRAGIEQSVLPLGDVA